MKSVFMSAFGLYVGEPYPLSDLSEFAEPDDLRGTLEAEGLSLARVCNRPAWAMASESASQSLAQVDRSRVDAVLFASETGSPDTDHTAEALRCAAGVGLAHVPITGVGLNRCANVGPLLSTAAAMVQSGQVDTCLCLTVDTRTSEDRLIPGDLGVYSDAAASVLVSGDPAGAPAYRILGIERVTRAELEFASYMVEVPHEARLFLSDLEVSYKRLLTSASLNQADLTWIVTNNYRSSAVNQIPRVLELPADLAYRGTVSDYGHCFAADALMSLQRMQDDAELNDGDVLLVVATAASTWTLVALEHKSGA